MGTNRFEIDEIITFSVKGCDRRDCSAKGKRFTLPSSVNADASLGDITQASVDLLNNQKQGCGGKHCVKTFSSSDITLHFPSVNGKKR